ncbi:hypothetical protein HOV03_gp60 [Gordonia phage Asapag]|uniref:Membrane protein n=2 Tax=Getalongvirus TaxID=2733156 RepID=A0A410TDV6_9CAUD|nr:hypothetical protein HOS44_gp064 [Gordonia phage BENtherdunthat]YP_009819105.1 hypothetical protein HOV03_gp60 [Gordonia phage Asapag]ATW60834.1 membrane protein [Gordonia phage BENtherdunthat]QAU07202.1 membrane protein [Gordonia phage Asapag]WIC40258.1 membrane protein [Gordonia phage Holliday]
MKAIIGVPAYLLFVLWFAGTFPPADSSAVLAYTIIALFGLMTVVAFCLPTPPREDDDRDVVGRALRVLPPDGGER